MTNEHNPQDGTNPKAPKAPSPFVAFAGIIATVVGYAVTPVGAKEEVATTLATAVAIVILRRR